MILAIIAAVVIVAFVVLVLLLREIDRNPHSKPDEDFREGYDD